MSTHSTEDVYNLPSLYDILHAPGTARDVDGLEHMAHRFVQSRPRAHRWFEPACGTGRFIRLAGARHIPAAGLDMNEAMIEYARRSAENLGVGTRTRFVVGDMRDFTTRQIGGQYDLAFNLINTIRHLENDADMLAHFVCMRAAIRTGGVYAVGIDTNQHEFDVPTEDVFTEARGPCKVTQVVQYLPPKPRGRFETVISHMTVKRPSGTSTIESSYRLRTYTTAQWKSLIAKSGFEVVTTVDEDGEDVDTMPSCYAIWILRNRH